MGTFFRSDKRQKEERRKKKQDEKRNRRLNKKEAKNAPDQVNPENPAAPNV